MICHRLSVKDYALCVLVGVAELCLRLRVWVARGVVRSLEVDSIGLPRFDVGFVLLRSAPFVARSYSQ